MMQFDVEGGVAAKISNKLASKAPKIKKLVSKAPKILHLSLRQKIELLNSYNKIIISVLCGELKARPVQ
jgi:hypothetical protein